MVCMMTLPPDNDWQIHHWCIGRGWGNDPRGLRCRNRCSLSENRSNTSHGRSLKMKAPKYVQSAQSRSGESMTTQGHGLMIVVVQVWVIPESNEVFTSYEPYLQRMDFYKQRRFICEITGHSGLTFFEALTSEVRDGSPGLSVSRFLMTKNLLPSQMDESREVNSSFPEALKEPILRRIQFSTVSRVDNLGMFMPCSFCRASGTDCRFFFFFFHFHNSG